MLTFIIGSLSVTESETEPDSDEGQVRVPTKAAPPAATMSGMSHIRFGLTRGADPMLAVARGKQPQVDSDSETESESEPEVELTPVRDFAHLDATLRRVNVDSCFLSVYILNQDSR